MIIVSAADSLMRLGHLETYRQAGNKEADDGNAELISNRQIKQ